MTAINIDQVHRNIRDLEDTVRYHERMIAEAAPDSLEAESHERMAGVAERLLEEQWDARYRIESNAARAVAEARLAYHTEHDTLDLY